LEFKGFAFSDSAARIKFEYGKSGNDLPNVLDPSTNRSSEGKEVLTSKGEGPWPSVDTSPLEFTYTQASNQVRSVALSKDRVAYCTGAPAVYVHKIIDDSLEYTFTAGANNAKEVKLNGEELAYTAGENTFVYSLSDGSQLYSLSQNTDTIWGVGLNDTQVAYGQGDTVFLHSLSDGSLETSFTQAVYRAYSPRLTDSVIAYVGADSSYNFTLYVHDLSDGSLMHEKTLSNGVGGIGLSNDYVGVGREAVEVYDLSDGSVLYTLTETPGSTKGIEIDENAIAYCTSEDSSKVGKVYVHNLGDGSLVATLEEATERLRGIGLTKTKVAYGGDDQNTYRETSLISLLSPSTEYEYRAVAEADNETRRGSIKTFTTS